MAAALIVELAVSLAAALIVVLAVSLAVALIVALAALQVDLFFVVRVQQFFVPEVSHLSNLPL